MITAYGMYNWPEAIVGINPFWSALINSLKAGGFDVDNTLATDRDAYDVWLNPEMLLAQTCGFPYVTKLKGAVQLVATPHYDVPGCAAASYRSVLLKRKDDTREQLSDFQGAIAVVNSFRSQSGCNALLGTLVREGLTAPFLNRLIKSGSHRASMKMLANNQADICAIDAVCWQLMQDFEPEIANQLAVVCWSDAQPGLPFITNKQATPEQLVKLRFALQSAVAQVPKTVGCYIKGFSVLTDADYAGITQMAESAQLAGFGALLMQEN
jgi:ABC-type phosphate/phosphonate transport system substrate-binding protein